MVEGPANEKSEIVDQIQEITAEASEAVLGGFQLRSDVEIIRWPDRNMDDWGREFWGRVMALIPAGSEAERQAETRQSLWVGPMRQWFPCPAGI